MGCYDVAPYTCSYDSGGNGSLPGGGNPDYSVLDTWEAASDNDLAGYTGPVVLDCYDSQDHTESTSLTGATNTSSTLYREIVSSSSCAVPWAGKVNTGANFSSSSAMIIVENYARIRNIYKETVANTSGAVYAFQTNNTVTGGKIINCVGSATNAGAGTATAFYSYWSPLVLFYNCIALNSKTDGFYGNSYTSGIASYFVNCTSINNGGIGFRSGVAAGTHVVTNCYAANNTAGDFSESNFDSPSGWNASKDNTSDLGGVTYYKNGLDLIASGDIDSDGLATADDLYDSSAASSSYGRNPYNDLSGTIDFDNFLKNDTDGEAISKKDIRGTDRPTPDTADCAWNVGASQMLAAPPATTSQPMFFIF